MHIPMLVEYLNEHLTDTSLSKLSKRLLDPVDSRYEDERPRRRHHKARQTSSTITSKISSWNEVDNIQGS